MTSNEHAAVPAFHGTHLDSDPGAGSMAMLSDNKPFTFRALDVYQISTTTRPTKCRVAHCVISRTDKSNPNSSRVHKTRSPVEYTRPHAALRHLRPRVRYRLQTTRPETPIHLLLSRRPHKPDERESILRPPAKAIRPVAFGRAAGARGGCATSDSALANLPSCSRSASASSERWVSQSCQVLLNVNHSSIL